MITTIKILLILAITLVLSYPFIPMKGKLRKLSVASRLKYESPHNRKNLFFLILAAVEFLVVVFVFKLLDGLAKFLYSLPLLGNLFVKLINSLNSQVDYVLLAIKLVLVNLIVLYAFILIKAFVKLCILNPIFGLGKKRKLSLFKKKKKGQKTDGDPDDSKGKNQPQAEDSEEEKKRKNRRIPDFVHSVVNDEDEAGDDKAKQKDINHSGIVYKRMFYF